MISVRQFRPYIYSSSACSGSIETRSTRDLLRQERGVVPDAIDERRVAAPLKVRTKHEQSGHGRDPFALPDLAAIVEHRHPQPRVTASEAGGPDHRIDAGRSQIDRRLRDRER